MLPKIHFQRSEARQSWRSVDEFNCERLGGTVGCSTGMSAGFAPFEDLVDESRRVSVYFSQVRAICHEATSLRVFPQADGGGLI